MVRTVTTGKSVAVFSTHQLICAGTPVELVPAEIRIGQTILAVAAVKLVILGSTIKIVIAGAAI